jgi:hypothetical protein
VLIVGCLTNKNRILKDNQAAINRVYKTYIGGARTRDLEFDLSLEDFTKLIFKNCCYCGAKPKETKLKQAEDYYYTISYNGLDRLNSDLGYSLDNCVTCCSSCNYAKSDLTLEEFKVWQKQMVNFNKNLIVKSGLIKKIKQSVQHTYNYIYVYFSLYLISNN